jgi:predicted Zn-dependent protease
LTKDSLIISAWLLRAEINFELANDEDASTELSKYLQYYPDNTIAQYLNAQINARRGDLLNAIAEFGRLIKLNPANPDYFIGRADAYFKTKTYTYAIKDYAMALDLDPKNIEVYKMKAKAHQLAGDLKGACINWQHAVRLGDIESRGFLQKYCKNLH